MLSIASFVSQFSHRPPRTNRDAWCSQTGRDQAMRNSRAPVPLGQMEDQDSQGYPRYFSFIPSPSGLLHHFLTGLPTGWATSAIVVGPCEERLWSKSWSGVDQELTGGS